VPTKTVCLIAGALALAGTFLIAEETAPLLGLPLPGITSREFELFRAGREDFLEVETASEGLGPLFNGTSCAQCHNIPAIGGTGTMVELRAGFRDEHGVFHAPPGGTLQHLFSTPPHDCQVSVYEEANVIAHRISIPLFGAGLIEAVADSTILALADPDDKDRDGVRGRAALVEDVATRTTRVGRFGWKAQQASLLAFAGDAYFNEMGITNDLFRAEPPADTSLAKLRSCFPDANEDIRDTRTGLRGVDNFANFLKFLAPPPRGAVTGQALRGERIFADIGCASCHRPQLETGPSATPALNRRPVPLFSDLLLHDIGTGDGIEQAAAKGEEIRTPALWGLRFRRPLLHDGSAATIEDAIGRHSVEGESSRQKFTALPATHVAELLAFLKSL